MGRMHIKNILAGAAVGIGKAAKVHLIEYDRGWLSEAEKVQDEACEQQGYYKACSPWPVMPVRNASLICHFWVCSLVSRSQFRCCLLSGHLGQNLKIWGQAYN